MNRRAALPSIALAVALSGCSLTPAYQRPAAAVPPAWPTGPAYAADTDAPFAAYPWRAVFADPRLQRLITAALASNQDLAAASAQIAAARAQAGIQRAQLLPELDAGFAFRRGTAGTESANADAQVTGYEVDLFGRLRALSGAAAARYFASESARRAVRQTLIADVAQAWINAAADASLLETARASAAAARDSLRLTRARLAGGIAPRSDVRQAEIALTTAEADLANQTTLVAQDRNALRLLLGSEPAEADLARGVDEAEAGIAPVPAGLTSDILLRRPDVLEAEWTLRAANAQIGAARAALFPRITLTALSGFIAPSLSALFGGGTFGWQGGPNATYPIFAGGAGKAGVALSEAQRDAALAAYRKAIQTAFADVANVLARRGTIAAQLAANEAGRTAAADNLKLADLRYKGGVDSYLADLTARQTLYTAERKRIATVQLSASSRAALYRALGGDDTLAAAGTRAGGPGSPQPR